MFKKHLAVVLISLLGSEAAFAKDILITNDTGTQGKGAVLVEVNGEYGSDQATSEGVSIKQTGIGVEAIFSYGVMQEADIIFAFPYLQDKVEENNIVIQNEKGISDISVELKWRFYETEGLSFALKPGLSLPTGNEKRGLGTGKAGYNLFLVSTKEVKSMIYNFNLAYFRNENEARERKDLWYASFAMEYIWRENMRFIVNTGIERSPEKMSNSHPAFVLGGINHSLTDKFDINAGVKAGLNSAETDITYLAGIAAKF